MRPVLNLPIRCHDEEAFLIFEELIAANWRDYCILMNQNVGILQRRFLVGPLSSSNQYPVRGYANLGETGGCRINGLANTPCVTDQVDEPRQQEPKSDKIPVNQEYLKKQKARSEVPELIGNQANKRKRVVTSRGSVVTEQAKPSVRILDVYAEHCQESVISMCKVRRCQNGTSIILAGRPHPEQHPMVHSSVQEHCREAGESETMWRRMPWLGRASQGTKDVRLANAVPTKIVIMLQPSL
ncbi:hypothetical protein EDD22DRAFT_1025777 [Suillus occidentalis]|nr:hypothetical protein EDD22DRAFT_1025777 [Suillus occidentalis]